METKGTPIRRLIATGLSVFIGVGLGLLGPASAMAQGVERGLNFTIVSDDIGKTANGSVPAAPTNNANPAPTDPAPTGDGGGEAPPPSGGSGGDPTSGGSGETTTGTSGGTSGSGGSAGSNTNYNTSKKFKSKGKSNQAKGKKSKKRKK